MGTFFTRPYSHELSAPRAVRMAIVFGAFVFLFLAVFEPFGLGTLSRPIWSFALGYGLTCSLAMTLLNLAVPRLVPAWFNEERWTTGRQILWTLVNIATVGLGNALYTVWAGIVPLTPGTILWFEVYTLLIGIFPVAAMVLWQEARLRHRYAAGSVRMNEELHPAPVTIIPGEVTAPPAGSVPAGEVHDVLITIPSESGRENMTLSLESLLFIRSAGNYIEVHHLDHGRTVRKVVRGSLKRVEEALAAHPRLLRCHKSHVVNLDRVVRVSGNAQGYHLHVVEDGDAVPVSRQLNNRLEELLAGRP